MTDNMTDADWIKAAIDNDPAALSEGVKFIFNCREAAVTKDGMIWIMDPQRGHWLDSDGLARIARALEAGDI